MSQHSFYIDNQAGAAFRAALNAALEALVTLSAGEVAPATTYPFQLWADTGAGQLKQRNAANDDWITLGALGAAYLGLLPAVPVAGNYLRLAGPNVPPEQRTPQELADELSPLLSGLVPRGHIAGLRVSNNAADPDNDIDIAPGEAADSTATYLLRLTSTLTKRLDATWAEGDGEGGLDTGSKAADTTYHVHLIRKDADSTVDALFSTSASSPTLPSGWSAYRRIFSVRTDSSGNILPFLHDGDTVWWQAPVDDVDTSTFGTTLTNFALTVPGAVTAIISARYSRSSTTCYGRLYSPDLPDIDAGSLTPAQGNIGGNSAAANSISVCELRIRTNTAGQIRGVSTADGCSLRISTLGYIDTRGRFD